MFQEEVLFVEDFRVATKLSEFRRTRGLEGQAQPELTSWRCYLLQGCPSNLVAVVDYQDAKEHLSALAHQLGPSLVDLEVYIHKFAVKIK
jgi:hypothetical protein